jgi:hypothetical protein
MFNLFAQSCLILSTLCSVYAVYYITKTYKNRRRYKHLPGPPADGISGFLFGNLFEIIELSKKGKSFCEIQAGWIEKYGSVIKFQMLSDIAVTTIEPTAVRVCLFLFIEYFIRMS